MSGAAGRPPAEGPPSPCPICGRPSKPEAQPFCSPRCANVDLGRWLTGRYAIPVAEEEGTEAPEGMRRDAGD